MSTTDIVRAWKNEDYLMSLSPSELSAIPENPAGNVELMRPETKGNPDVSFIFPATKCCSTHVDCTFTTTCH